MVAVPRQLPVSPPVKSRKPRASVPPGSACSPLPARISLRTTAIICLLMGASCIAGSQKGLVRSGIRFDYLLADKDDSFFRDLVNTTHLLSLEVALEHILRLGAKAYGKPPKRRL